MLSQRSMRCPSSTTAYYIVPQKFLTQINGPDSCLPWARDFESESDGAPARTVEQHQAARDICVLGLLLWGLMEDGWYWRLSAAALSAGGEGPPGCMNRLILQCTAEGSERGEKPAAHRIFRKRG